MVGGKEEIEIGYHINKKFWFKGIPTEAALTWKEYAFQSLSPSVLLLIQKTQPPLEFLKKSDLRKKENGSFLIKFILFIQGIVHSSKN